MNPTASHEARAAPQGVETMADSELKATLMNVITDEQLFHCDLDSGNGEKWDSGFMAGMAHLKDNIIPQVLSKTTPPQAAPAPCPGCEAAAKQIRHRERQIASLIEGIDKWESRYFISRQHNEKLATNNYRLSVIEQELADLKSNKAQADKLAAERGDELSNLRREHYDFRARLAAKADRYDNLDFVDRSDDVIRIVEKQFRQFAADLRALLAETEAK